MSADFDIQVPRQGDWLQALSLPDIDGVPIDITGATLAWSARALAGTGAVLASAAIEIVDPDTGSIEARWHGPDFDPFGLPTEVVRVAHDLKMTYSDGVVQVLLRGQLIIYPEVTA